MGCFKAVFYVFLLNDACLKKVAGKLSTMKMHSFERTEEIISLKQTEIKDFSCKFYFEFES